jgi:ubiquinone biosynthesis protein
MLGVVGDFWRLSRADYVVAREGLLRFVPAEKLSFPARLLLRLARLVERPAAEKEARPKSFSKALSRLGPSWIKLGQFLSTRPDIVGAVMARDLEHLQDRLPPFPQKQAVQKIEKAFGKPLDEIFVSFGPPVAAASIAQVHRAQLRTGGVIEDVAVKVLRPHIERRFSRDLRAFFTAARLIEFFSPASRRLHPVGVVQTLARSVAMEMDMRLEAAALSEMAENTVNDEDFIVPQVKWAAVAQDVLTTEWIEGTPLNDMAALKAAKHDLKKLAQSLMQNFLKHALRDGFFHADMHQGNLFVDAEGRIVAVDFGIMGRINEKERRFLAEILWGFIIRDYKRGAEAHFEAGYVPRHQSRAVFAQALRAIGEPIHEKKASDISMARVLGQLLEYTELFHMETRCELILLQKTMAVTEGVARNLDPDFDMWETAKPVVEAWMRDNLGAKGQGRLATNALRELSKFVRDLPEHLQNLNQMTREGLRLSPDSIARLAKEQEKARRWQTAALWAIALALFALLLF